MPEVRNVSRTSLINLSGFGFFIRRVTSPGAVVVKGAVKPLARRVLSPSSNKENMPPVWAVRTAPKRSPLPEWYPRTPLRDITSIIKCKMPRYDDRSNGYDRYGGNTKLYVGRLSTRTRMQDLEHLFSRYGRVRHVDLKYDYGFVEFSDPRDADDARYELDGREFDGSHLIVEFAKGTPRGPGGSHDYMGRGPPPGSGRCFNCGIDGHWANDCNAGDWKNKCYRCGERGHIERNCQNSAKNLKRGRSYTRSPPPRRGRSRSKSYSRSRSRSHSRPHSPRRDGRGAGREERFSPRRDGRGTGREERLPPRRDGRGTGREERRSRSLGYSRSPRGSASPSQGRNRSPKPNVMSPPPRERAERNGSYPQER